MQKVIKKSFKGFLLLFLLVVNIMSFTPKTYAQEEDPCHYTGWSIYHDAPTGRTVLLLHYDCGAWRETRMVAEL